MCNKQAKALSRSLRKALRRLGVSRYVVNESYCWNSCGGTIVIGNYLFTEFSHRQLRIMANGVRHIEESLRKTYIASSCQAPLAWHMPVEPQKYDWGKSY